MVGTGVTFEMKKPRSSSKPGRVYANKTTTTITSEHFNSRLKAQPTTNNDNDEDDIVVPMATTTAETDTESVNEEVQESEDDDWEEVEELTGALVPVEPPEPLPSSRPVEIEIETPDIIHRRRRREKRKAMFETYLRRVTNRYKKDLLIDTHKAHLVCLIANGMFQNRICSEPELRAIALSLLPVHFSDVAKESIDNHYLSGLLKWFAATFTLNPALPCEKQPDPRGVLERRLASLSARDHQDMTHLFLLVLRSLQLFCRLVLSLQPIPLKPPPAGGEGANSSSSAPGQSKPPGQKTSKNGLPSEPRVSPGTKRHATTSGKTKGESWGKKNQGENIKEEEEEDVEGERGVTMGRQKPKKNVKRCSVASKVSYKEESCSEEGEEFQVTSEEESEDPEGRAKSQKRKSGKGRNKNNAAPPSKSGEGRSTKRAKINEEDNNNDWEGDNEEEDERRETSEGARRKSGGEKTQTGGADEWLEVYVPKTSSWVCVDVWQGVGRPHLCFQNATAPVTYVVSVDGEGRLKDLGRKYDPSWMTLSRKRRVEEDWWEDTLRPFLGPEDERDRREDKEIDSVMLDKPLPMSIAEYKNHPLYSLKRHLLKYEAFYPHTAAVLGYCRGEPVYSRDCVHSLHSRDTWMKEARTVRPEEEPYKMVKGFSNRSRKTRIMSEQKDLPLFGEWQTEEYQPPIAVDGKVPRNEYGNVYLFKPCMLPVGCVHLRLPSLHRVAKKLDMDAVPAVTGFDFHGGYSHAVTDGYVVCEEHEEILRAAWVEDQEIQRQKEREKQEKRVIFNWTLLVKGLLIRERLKQRYGKRNQWLAGGAGTSSQTHTLGGEGAGGLSSDDGEGESGVPGMKTAAETLAMSWPQNRQEEQDRNANAPTKKTTKREKRGQQKHLFPFEKV